MKENSNNLVASIKRGIKDSFNFDGKSNRFEFITYFIFAVLFIYGSGLLLYQIIEYFVLPDSLFFNFYIFLSFLMGISFLANVIRRINDLKMSRWSIILGFIPILGILFVVYLAIKKGEESFNS